MRMMLDWLNFFARFVFSVLGSTVVILTIQYYLGALALFLFVLAYLFLDGPNPGRWILSPIAKYVN